MLLRLHLGVLDLAGGELRTDAGPVGLSPTELGVLTYLAEQDRAVSQEELLAEVWGYSAKVRSRTVRVTINRIRTKIERDPKAPAHLLTEVGLGYRFEALDEATPLVGRAADKRRLQEAGRLVTVTGPGGVGKTSLVRDLAALQPAVWVDCERAETAEELVDTVAAALGLGLSPDPARAIARAQPPLLVLDNLEQLRDPSPIAGWTRGRVIGTSRSALGLPGEQVVPLAPLAEGDARALLSQRWTQAGAAPLTQRQATALVERLGGLPLALELVSSWATLLSPEDVLTRLERGVGWVTDSRKPGRHSSLLAVVAGSWALLSADEQALLAQLTAFAGAARLADAEAVLRPTDGVLAGLRRLKELGLVRPDLSLPVPVREFAGPHCPPAALARHREHFLARAEALPGRGPDFRRTLAVLTRDRQELLAAHGRCDDPADQLRLVRVLEPVLQYYGPSSLALALWRGHTGAGHARSLRVSGRLDEAVAQAQASGAVQQESRARVLLGQGDEALVLAERAVAEASRPADRAECVLDLARLRQFRGENQAAIAGLREALALAVESGDTLVEAQVLCHLGELLTLLVDREAVALLERALALDPTPSLRLMTRSRLANALGRFDADADVAGLLRASIDEARRLGLEPAEQDALITLGSELWGRGALDEAEQTLRQVLARAAPADHGRGLALANLAGVLAEQGRASESLALAEAAQACRTHPFFAAWAGVLLALGAGFRGEDPLGALSSVALGALAGMPVCHGLALALIAVFDPEAPVPELIGDPEVDCLIGLARARRGAPQPRRLWPGAAVRMVSQRL